MFGFLTCLLPSAVLFFAFHFALINRRDHTEEFAHKGKGGDVRWVCSYGDMGGQENDREKGQKRPKFYYK